MIKLHAKPKTHPGGVQGAWFRLLYHSFSAGLSPIKRAPSARAPKFMIKNIINLIN
jgi:hypothetical protein